MTQICCQHTSCCAFSKVACNSRSFASASNSFARSVSTSQCSSPSCCCILASACAIETKHARNHITQLPTSVPDFSSFESSSVTLQLSHSKLSVFNIYRPPSSSTHSKPFSVFLDDFSSFLSSTATTPHEFIITGDFNTHLDNHADTLTSQFLSLLSSFNLSQHVHFPTHDKNQILDLVITSSDTSLRAYSGCFFHP